MKIGRVETHTVRYPEPNNDGKIRSLCLVRIETDDGLVGWGEAISGAPVISLSVAFVIKHRLTPLVYGRDPRDVAGAWQAMRDATYWDGNGGIVSFGISAIDMALWDIAGKAAGQPMWALLGGRRQERLPACASIIFATDDLDRIGREFSGFVEQGYRFVKGGWGHDLSIAFGLDEARDLAIARTVREAIGPDTEMIVDVVANAGWDSSHAIRMCRTPPARGGRDTHLHRREGLACGPLQEPHRVGSRRRDHGRSWQGRGSDRRVEHHQHGGRSGS